MNKTFPDIPYPLACATEQGKKWLSIKITGKRGNTEIVCFHSKMQIRDRHRMCFSPPGLSTCLKSKLEYSMFLLSL